MLYLFSPRGHHCLQRNPKEALTAGSLHRRVPTEKRSPSHNRAGYGAESTRKGGSAVSVTGESEMEDEKCAAASLLR